MIRPRPRASIPFNPAHTVRKLLETSRSKEQRERRIGFFAPPAAPFLPFLVAAFRGTHRKVRIELREMMPAEQAEALRNGSIDFSFNRPLPETERDGLGGEPIHRDRLVAVLPSSHPLTGNAVGRLTVAKLAREPFVMLDRREAPGLVDLMLSVCIEAGFSPDVRTEARTMSTVLLLVACGIGVTLASSSVRHLNQSGVVFRDISPVSPPIDLMCYWNAKHPSPTAAAFRALIRENLPMIRKTMLTVPACGSGV